MFAMYFVFSCETSKSQDKRVNCTAKVVTCKARVKKGKPRARLNCHIHFQTKFKSRTHWLSLR